MAMKGDGALGPEYDHLRVKLFYLYQHDLENLLHLNGDTTVHFSGLPKDASIVGISWPASFNDRKLAIKFQSREFDVIPPGADIPELKLEQRWTHLEAWAAKHCDAKLLQAIKEGKLRHPLEG